MIAVAITACSSESPTDLSAGMFCTDALGVSISPRDTTLNVGDHFRPTVSISYCGSVEVEMPTFTSNNTDVAVLTPVIRDIHAIRSGTAQIAITSKRYGNIGAVVVTVR